MQKALSVLRRTEAVLGCVLFGGLILVWISSLIYNLTWADIVPTAKNITANLAFALSLSLIPLAFVAIGNKRGAHDGLLSLFIPICIASAVFTLLFWPTLWSWVR